MKPEDLDDGTPIEPDASLLASVQTRSRSFRRRRTTQRFTSVTAGLLVIALATGVALTRTESGRRANPTLATTTTTAPASTLTEDAILGEWKPVSISGYGGSLDEPRLAFDGDGGWSANDGCNSYSNGTYRLEGITTRLVGGDVTQAECARYHDTYPDPGYPDFRGPVVGAVRIELHGEQLIFFDAAGEELARFERSAGTTPPDEPAKVTPPATITGTWLAYTIYGYGYISKGPLGRPGLDSTPQLTLNENGEWNGSDGCNQLSGTYKFDEDGIHFDPETITTTRNCGPDVPDFAQIRTAARSEIHSGRLTFLAADGAVVARFIRPDVTARIELETTTLKAGSSTTAQVVVENDTGHEVPASMCGSFFQIELSNDQVKAGAFWTQCAVPFTFPVGESRYRVTVQAVYGVCAADLAGTPPCLATGPPPLPPGRYHASLLQSSPVVSLPPPVDFTVTP